MTVIVNLINIVRTEEDAIVYKLVLTFDKVSLKVSPDFIDKLIQSSIESKEVSMKLHTGKLLEEIVQFINQDELRSIGIGLIYHEDDEAFSHHQEIDDTNIKRILFNMRQPD